MPYLVTITHPRTRSAIHPDSGVTTAGDGRPSPFTFATRTAYADLHEARAAILTELGDYDAITGPEDPACGLVLDLQHNGGTIDAGRVLAELNPRTWHDLIDAIGGGIPQIPEHDGDEIAVEIIDTYNDAQRRTTA